MKKLMTVAALLLAVCALGAEPDYYAQLAVWAPGQLPTSADTTIWGVRASVCYGECRHFSGLDVGLAGRVRERAYGLQVGGCFNWVGSGAGWQIGFANVAESYYYGLQTGAWNHADFGAGWQIGLVNTASYYAGVQLGVFNWADDLDGVQIGLSSVVWDQTFSVLPIVNVGF